MCVQCAPRLNGTMVGSNSDKGNNGPIHNTYILVEKNIHRALQARKKYG